jgi:pimeloyl-ACP methyl ester carboxylesterase
MAAAPIVLVPGFWLGAWAWDEVAAALRADGHDVTAVTLPGLESADADRANVSFADHVDAISAAVAAAPAPAVLALHSGAGVTGYAATDLVADRLAAVVYVDSAPGKGPMDADFADTEFPLPSWEDLDENLDGLTDEHLARFRERAVPQPGRTMSEGVALTNDARLDLPTTLICTGNSSDEVKAWIPEGHAFLAGLSEVRDVTYVDLPTSHWPMWSRPAELAAIIGDVATRYAPA